MHTATTTDEVLRGIDLSGQMAVITGASGGLGLETARALAAAGATVVLAARDPAKTDAALHTIRERVPGARVQSLTVDLTSLANVRRCAREFLAAHDRLQLLINNAGVMATPFRRTADGFELHFGTNHLGHFLLTGLLAPALLRGAPARIVNVTSGGHMVSDIIWDDPNFERRPYDKWVAYGQSKTANILFSVELERRLGAHGVHAFAVHPGRVRTDLQRNFSQEDYDAMAAMAARNPNVRTLPSYIPIPEGAATSVWAATAPELAQQGGTYLADCAISTDHAPWARDPDAARRLWTLSEQLVGETFAL